MKIGDICLVNGVSSVESLLLYKNLQNRYPTLICPCHLPNTMELEVVGELTKKAVIVKTETEHMSVFMKKDLRVLRPKSVEA